MMKKGALLISLALLFLLTLAPIIQAASIPKPVGDIYVQDFADLLSKEQVAEINQFSRNLDDATGAQIAVLTIDTLDGEDIQSFSNRAFREYALGDAEKDNGVLLVIAIDDRDMRVEVGYGLEGALPDGKVGRILDDFTVPYMKQEVPDQAIMNTMKVLYEEVSKEYNWDGEPVNPEAAEGSSEDGGGFSPIIIIIIIFVLFSIFRNRGGPGSGGRRRGFSMMGPGSFGGGRGSGGGGFRSGGGGSSGGGGAGRSW